MGADLGQSQLGDVLKQRFEAFVFANPLLDLWEEIVGDVNGAGFALHLEGQVMAEVAFTGLAAAAGPAAFSAESDEAGGDERAIEVESLDTSGQEAGDQGGVLGYFHGAMVADYGAGIY
jgi:hypothetical protein